MVTVLAASIIVTPVFAAPSVDELEQSKASAQSEVSSKQQELTDLLVEIDELESKLISKGQEITQATEDLGKAQEKEQEQYEAMKIRIQYMYEEGNNSAAEKILESQSLSDVLNQAEYVNNVHSYDRKKLDEYVETKQEITDLKATLEKEQNNLESMQASYETEKETLNSTIEEKQAEVAGFDQQIQEAAVAAAAERQKALEEQAKQNSESGSSTKTESPSNGNTGNSTNNPADSSGGGTSSQGSGQAIVNAARAYLGVPYVWGGQSGSGVDCSGLVLLAHRAIGVSLPHSSGSQGGGGKAVSGMANALPGDVVCYSGHVGIYIGGGQMIHAPQPGDVVKIANVYGSPWFRRYW